MYYIKLCRKIKKRAGPTLASGSRETSEVGRKEAKKGKEGRDQANVPGTGTSDHHAVS